ncbi:MAG: hypothetical protein AAF797_02845 [Planctomycetota bacterium]
MATTAWSIRDISIPPSLRFAVAIGSISVTITATLAVGMRLLNQRIILPINNLIFSGSWWGWIGVGTMASLFMRYMTALAILLINHEKRYITSTCWITNGLTFFIFLSLATKNLSVLLFEGTSTLM